MMLWSIVSDDKYFKATLYQRERDFLFSDDVIIRLWRFIMYEYVTMAQCKTKIS